MATKIDFIDPITTGAAWEQDFVFQLADGSPRTDWVDCTAAASLAPWDPRSRSPAFEVAEADIQVDLTDETGPRVMIRVSGETTAGYPVDEYRIQVDRVTSDGAWYAEVLGPILIQQGIPGLIGQPRTGRPANAGSKAGTIIVKAPGSSSATGAGPKGDPGLSPAEKAELLAAAEEAGEATAAADAATELANAAAANADAEAQGANQAAAGAVTATENADQRIAAMDQLIIDIGPLPDEVDTLNSEMDYRPSKAIQLYGAVPDGVTPADAAINARLAVSTTVGPFVGTLLLASQHLLASKRRYFSNTFLGGLGTGDAVFKSTGAALTDILFDDVSITSQVLAGMHINSMVTGLTLRDCTINAAGFGFLTNSGATGASRIKLRGGYFRSENSDAVELNHPSHDTNDMSVIGTTLETGSVATSTTSGFAVAVAGVRDWVIGFNHIIYSRQRATHIEDTQRGGRIIGNSCAQARSHGIDILQSGTVNRTVAAGGLTWTGTAGGAGIMRCVCTTAQTGDLADFLYIDGMQEAGFGGVHVGRKIDDFTWEADLVDPGAAVATTLTSIIVRQGRAGPVISVGNSYRNTTGRINGNYMNIVNDVNGSLPNCIFVANNGAGWQEGGRGGANVLTIFDDNVVESSKYGLNAADRSRIMGSNLFSNVRIAMRGNPGSVFHDKQLFATEPDIILERAGTNAPGPMIRGFAGVLSKTRTHTGTGAENIRLFPLPTRMRGWMTTIISEASASGLLFEAYISWVGGVLTVQATDQTIMAYSALSAPQYVESGGYLCLRVTRATAFTFNPYVEFSGMFAQL